jgi:hypothetical protein
MIRNQRNPNTAINPEPAMSTIASICNASKLLKSGCQTIACKPASAVNVAAIQVRKLHTALWSSARMRWVRASGLNCVQTPSGVPSRPVASDH